MPSRDRPDGWVSARAILDVVEKGADMASIHGIKDRQYASAPLALEQAPHRPHRAR